MRLSAEGEDPDFDRAAQVAEIFLDGVKQRRVISADEDKGVVVLYAEGPNGRMVVQGEDYARETRTGEVVIQIPPEDRQRILLERMARA